MYSVVVVLRPVVDRPERMVQVNQESRLNEPSVKAVYERCVRPPVEEESPRDSDCGQVWRQMLLNRSVRKKAVRVCTELESCQKMVRRLSWRGKRKGWMIELCTSTGRQEGSG